MEEKTAVKYRLKLDGMRCSMCEEHVNNVIRKVKGVRKVNSSHRKNEAVVIMDADTDRSAIVDAITAQGYHVLGQEEKPYVKRSFFSFLHR